MRSYPASLLLCVALLGLTFSHASAQTRAEIQQKLDQARNDFGIALAAYNDAKSYEDQWQSVTDSYDQTFTSYEDLIPQAETTESMANEEVGFAQTAFNEATNALQAATDRVGSIEGQLTSLQNQIGGLQGQADDCMDQADQLEAQADEIMTEVYWEFLQDPCGYWDYDAEQEATALYAEADALRAEAENLSSEASALEGTQSEMQVVLDQAIVEETSAQAAKQTAEGNLTSMTSLRDQAHSIVVELNSLLEQCRDLMREAFRQCNIFRDRRINLDRELDELDWEIAGYEDWLANNP